MHVIGSIAFVYESILREVAEAYSVKIGKVMKTPIEGLLAYHLE